MRVREKHDERVDGRNEKGERRIGERGREKMLQTYRIEEKCCTSVIKVLEPLGVSLLYF